MLSCCQQHVYDFVQVAFCHTSKLKLELAHILIIVIGVWKIGVHNQFWAVALDYSGSSLCTEDMAQICSNLHTNRMQLKYCE